MGQEQEKTLFRRANIYIDKKFQTKFILKFCALVAVGAGITILLLYIFSQQATSVAFINARVKVMTTADFILPLMVQTVLVVMGFVSIAAVAVTLVVSHKIAGPLYRFKQTFKELANGNFTNQVRLRKGDQLIEVSTDINLMITEVHTQLTAARKALHAIKSDIDAIGEFNVEDAKRRRFHDLQHHVQALEKALDHFKV